MMNYPMSVTEVIPEEKVFTWEALSQDQVAMVIAAHSKIAPRKKELLRRLFDLGRPKIVFGPQYKYCRIHHDSVEVMKIITKQYL
jgi:hypothetical protein